ncbi:hypothetical protein [Glaciibacter superstes]|uniref:hypothetical protein n=1 Tax=Glaciibacter superstes TaxID=501023 RepID=UPI0003B55A82|nr:hypothetical protein [Glaciibacter superstes]
MINDTTLDYRPLTDPVDRAEVTAFRKRVKAAGESWATSSTGSTVLLIFVLLIAGVVGLVGLFNFILVSGGSPATVLVVFLSIVAVAVAGTVITRWYSTGPGGQWGRWHRLAQFASVNGLRSIPTSNEPGYPGSIFQVGSGRTCTDRIQTVSGRETDVGSYAYTTGSGKSKQTHSWGYLALRLDRNLPHMVLDAKSNNGLFGGTNLPTKFDGDQVLSLEGDFDRCFTLYCPQHYERDALYVFTPDLMALLIDETSAFDVEIIDDWMFVYSADPFDALDPSMWKRMFRIVSVVGAKTVDQTERYRDERMLPAAASVLAGAAATGNRVAPAGRRLRTKINWIAVGSVAVFAVAWFWITLR